MIFYHFTDPTNLFRISLNGLVPGARQNTAFMTGNVPVVWLTRDDSNIARADDIEFIRRHSDMKIKEGDLLFGGNARLVVNLQRHDKRLFRYLDYLGSNGADVAKIRQVLFQRALTSWWVYTGLIPPSKIDLGVPPVVALECLDHHIATHPDIEARARFAAMRSQVEGLQADQRIHFGCDG
jgi:hypothetical protein